MVNYHEILRLTIQGYNQSEIARSTTYSRGTVAKVLAEAKKAGSLEELVQKDDAELRALLFPEAEQGPTKWVPDFEKLRKELARKGVTKSLLWAEYVKEAAQLGRPAYSYSQFCFYFQQSNVRHNATMHMNRKPGESLEVDWSGDKIPLLDPSGKAMQAHIFVAVLSYSQYTYVEAFGDEGQESWITAHLHAFEFFGGVAREVIPDNCKTAVQQNSRDETLINVTYREMSEYYSTIIMPARVRATRDKPNVESGVGAVQRLVLAPMRNTQFASLAELNRSIRNRIDEFNNRPFQKKDGSRRSLFEEEEKHLLIPLPETPYEIATWKIATVQFNYHVSVDKKMYSVPFTYIGKKVDVKITRTLVEVYCNHARIASHQRSYDPKIRYITVAQHMPNEHQQMAKWDGKTLRDWAERIGESTYAAIDDILRSRKVEQQGFKSCLAILNLSRRHSESLLELACKQAIELGCVNLKAIQKIIRSLTKKAPSQEPHTDANDAVNSNGITRGPEYFERSNS